MSRVLLRTVAGIVVLALLLGSGALLFARVGRAPGPSFRIDELAQQEAYGTAPRVEREFKLGLRFPSNSEYLQDDGLEVLGSHVFEALQDELASSEWEVPRVVGQPYRIARDVMQLVNRDFYLDTDESVALDNAAAFRLRYRFNSVKEVHDHERAPRDRRYFPYRIEVQVKTDRQERGDGFSTATEARFEFRIESPPFSPNNPPPPPPWLPEEYLPVAQSGRYQDMVTTPGQLLARFLKDRGVSRDLRFGVVRVLISTRIRMHLNVTTRYGSGPNPDQAFIISIDRAEVFDGEEYQGFLARASDKKTSRPRPLGTLLELEIEFERNVSTRIDELIENGEGGEVEDARSAFLRDQQRIRGIVTRAIEALGGEEVGVSSSKYQQARGLAKP